MLLLLYNYISRMGGWPFPVEGGGSMVTYVKLVDTLINFGIFLATSLTAILAIFALVVPTRQKSNRPSPVQWIMAVTSFVSIHHIHVVTALLAVCGCMTGC